MRTRSSIPILASALLAGCGGSSEGPLSTSDLGVGIMTAYTVAPVSRAEEGLQETRLPEGARAGFFVVSERDNTLLYGNAEHVSSGSGFTAAGSPMLWPLEGDISVYAYVPYDASVTLDRPAGVSVAADQTGAAGYLASDLLWGTPGTNPVPNHAYETQGSRLVSVTLTHRMARLRFIIRTSIAGMTVADGTLSVLGTVTGATFDALTGAVAPLAGVAAEEIRVGSGIGLDADTRQRTVAGIIVPQTVAAGTELFRLTDGGTVYRYVAPLAVTYEGGHEYTYTVNLKPDGASFQLTGDITGWTGDDMGGIDMDATGGGGTEPGPGPDNPDPEGNIKTSPSVGDWYLGSGKFYDGSKAVPDGAVGIVFNTADVPAGYSAYVSAFDSFDTYYWASATGPCESLISGTTADTFSEAYAARNGLELTRKLQEKSDFAAYTPFAAALSAPAPAAPVTSSGWFIPSAGEFMLLASYLTGGGTWAKDPSGTIYPAGLCSSGLSLPGQYVAAQGKYGFSFPKSIGYWTISEYDESHAWIVLLKESGPQKATTEPLKSTTRSPYSVHLILLAE